MCNFSGQDRYTGKKRFLGAQVSKSFGMQHYNGVVTTIFPGDETIYHVVYQDGDCEDMSGEELDLHVDIHRKRMKMNDYTFPSHIKALQIHMPINVNSVKNVKRYHSRPDCFSGSVDEIPQPIQVKGQSLWEVEEILAERVKSLNRKKPLHQVLVKWTGFNAIDATWEPICNMPTAVLEQWRQLQQEQIVSGST